MNSGQRWIKNRLKTMAWELWMRSVLHCDVCMFGEKKFRRYFTRLNNNNNSLPRRHSAASCGYANCVWYFIKLISFPSQYRRRLFTFPCRVGERRVRSAFWASTNVCQTLFIVFLRAMKPFSHDYLPLEAEFKGKMGSELKSRLWKQIRREGK